MVTFIYNKIKKIEPFNLAIFFLFLAIVLSSKLGVLNTPYYWDEITWIRGSHWFYEEGLLRFVPGLYPSNLFMGHPPLLCLGLAFLYKIFRESIFLSHLYIVSFSFLGVYFTYLLASYLFGRFTGIIFALLLFSSSIYFAQSGMFLGDLPITALGVMTVYLLYGKTTQFISYAPFLW